MVQLELEGYMVLEDRNRSFDSVIACQVEAESEGAAVLDKGCKGIFRCWRQVLMFDQRGLQTWLNHHTDCTRFHMENFCYLE
jgi:hypothetical protein